MRRVVTYLRKRYLQRFEVVPVNNYSKSLAIADGFLLFQNIVVTIISIRIMISVNGGIVMSLILRLSNGEKIEMKASLEEFEEMYLRDDGYFHYGYIRFVLNDGKEELSELIFTNHIVSIEEVK